MCCAGGKTSLLSILGNRTQKEVEVKGSILFNGQRPGHDLKRKLGFVTQDDLLFPALTVWETLWYVAQLRLPGSMSQTERSERVNTVISTLGLESCQNTIIGGAMRRGVSGGERKRVSVGHEMIINPSVLFLDEPTSGLDSTTALALVGTLRRLASAGRTIITTIHQPSSKMYQQLDKLLLLSQGHTMYYGDAQEVGPWFGNLGFPCPYGVNLADHILDMATGNNGNRSGESKEKARLMQVQSFQDLQKSSNKFDLMTGHSSAVTGDESERMSQFSVEEVPVSDGPRWAAKWWKQVSVLTVRNFKVNRFERVNTQTILQTAGVSLIVGGLWWQQARTDTIQSARDTIGLLFFEMLFPMFSALFSALFVFPGQMQFLKKERASGMYRLSAYYVSKTVSDLPLDLFLPTLGVFIMYFMTGLRLHPAGAFFANWFLVLLLILSAQGYGLILGAGFSNPKTSQTIATVSMLTLMLVGGFYVADVPVWIGWLKYLSFIYYGFNVLLHVEFGGRTLYDCTSGECVPVENLQQALGLQKDPNAPVHFDYAMLFVMFVVFRGALYFVLNTKTKASQNY